MYVVDEITLIQYFSGNQLESAMKTEKRHHDNLVQAIKEGGEMRSLVDALAGSEAEINLLAKQFTELAPSAESKDIRLCKIRKFIDRHADSFEQILLEAAEALKIEFQRRVTSALIVTPIDTAERRVFRVTGGVGLFSPEERAMLSNRVNQIGQHCTIPVDFVIRLYVSQTRRTSVSTTLTNKHRHKKAKPYINSYKSNEIIRFIAELLGYVTAHDSAEDMGAGE
jgi:hypothetical protein